MRLIRLLRIVGLVTIMLGARVTVSPQGLILAPVFFAVMAPIGWPEQFNLDLRCLVARSASWAWLPQRASARR